MCSRYTLTSPAEAVRRVFGHLNEAEFPPRYNIAPTQPVPIVRIGHNGARELVLVRWGLIPSWVKDPRAFSTLINARGETVAEKPSFRSAMRYRRCLVPADGFYEWTGPKGAKQPHLIRPLVGRPLVGTPPAGQRPAGAAGRVGEPMALAGIWEHWMGAEGSEMETMAILTTAANQTIAPIHDRMPVILAPADFALWLDCSSGKAGEAAALIAPAPDDLLECVAVSAKLNNPRHEGPEVQEPQSG